MDYVGLCTFYASGECITFPGSITCKKEIENVNISVIKFLHLKNLIIYVNSTNILSIKI